MIESSKQTTTQSQSASTFQDDQNNINMKKLITVIRRDQVDSKQVNVYVSQIFATYHVNKIRNHDLYEAILLDLFELKQEH
jgi:hypothetical protein